MQVVLLISMPVSILFVMGGMTGATAKWDKTVSLFWYSLLFFLYVIYPMVSVQCLSTFSCHNIGPAGNWLVAGPRAPLQLPRSSCALAAAAVAAAFHAECNGER
eukprot:1075841-Rhodomonas_salina.4